MKKIKISESDLYEIIKRVLLEQEEQKEVWITDNKEFKSRLDDVFDGNSEKFTKVHNKHYGKIVINGDLYLSNTQITSLPDNLYVEGDLYLSNTQITSLPDNLYVEGDLDLQETPITSLPDNLYVGGSLILVNTKIKSLSDNLKVKEFIYIYGTPLNDNDELINKYKKAGYDLI